MRRGLPCMLLLSSSRHVLVRSFASLEEEPTLGIIYPASGQSIPASPIINIAFDRQDTVCFGMIGNELTCAKEPLTGIEIRNLHEGFHEFRIVSSAKKEIHLYLQVEVASPEIFLPTYEWQTVLSEQFVPGGLEIQLPLNGKQKIAKIPQPWRIQIFVEEVNAFYRQNIYQHTPISYLEHDIYLWARQFNQHLPPRVRLAYGPDLLPLHPKATASDINLFTHRHNIHLLWDENGSPTIEQDVLSVKSKSETRKTSSHQSVAAAKFEIQDLDHPEKHSESSSKIYPAVELKESISAKVPSSRKSSFSSGSVKTTAPVASTSSADRHTYLRSSKSSGASSSQLLSSSSSSSSSKRNTNSSSKLTLPLIAEEEKK